MEFSEEGDQIFPKYFGRGITVTHSDPLKKLKIKYYFNNWKIGKNFTNCTNFQPFFLFNFFSLESDKVPVKFVGSFSPVGWINSEVICQSISLTPRCPSHRGVWLRGVLPIVESDSAVSFPSWSLTPRCPAHRLHEGPGWSVHGVRHGNRTYDQLILC